MAHPAKSRSSWAGLRPLRKRLPPGVRDPRPRRLDHFAAGLHPIRMRGRQPARRTPDAVRRQDRLGQPVLATIPVPLIGPNGSSWPCPEVPVDVKRVRLRG
jgi:hypothetical protein